MSAIQSFYLEHIETNFYGLEGLMHHSEALTDIEALSKDPKFQKPSKEFSYFDRWSVIWITVTHPLYSIFSIFSSAISLMAYCLYLPKVARVFTVLSKQMVRDWQQLCSQWEFNSPLLMPSFNIHQFFSWDLYKHGDVPYSSIADEDVRSLSYQHTALKNGVKRAMDSFYHTLEETRKDQSWKAWIYNRGRTLGKKERDETENEFFEAYKSNAEEAISDLRNKYSWDQIDEPINALYGGLKETEKVVQTNHPSISLFSDQGSCRGGSLWFIFLYHKTQHLFDDPTKHLMAIAKQFASGMPRQAALLQAFDDTDELLKLKKEAFHPSTVTLYELDHHLTSARKKIELLPFGIYRVGSYHHSLVYVKLSEDEQYVWNPEFGLYPMQEEEMLQMIHNHHYKPKDPDSVIYFHRYESKEPGERT